jgi:hypothetical protein
VVNLSRLRWPIIVIGGAVFAALLAFAAFSLSDVAGEKADAAAQDETEEPITIQQHAWEDYHWLRTADQVPLTLGDNVSTVWDKWLIMAEADWDQSTVLATTVGAGKASSRDLKSKKCPAVNGRVEVCNAAYGYNGGLGIAQIWLDTNHHITAGTAKLNDSYYSMQKYNTDYWRSHVMCQEVGHTFGLGHQDETGADWHTCMDYASSPDGDNMHPNAHDYDELLAIYNHTESTSTTSTMPTAASRGLYNSRSEWGRLKNSSADGHNEIYEREFSDGKLVTFVEKPEPEDQPQQKNQEKQQDQ